MASSRISRHRPAGSGSCSGHWNGVRRDGRTREDIPTSTENATISTAVRRARPSGGWYGTDATAANAKMWTSDPAGRWSQ